MDVHEAPLVYIYIYVYGEREGEREREREAERESEKQIVRERERNKNQSERESLKYRALAAQLRSMIELHHETFFHLEYLSSVWHIVIRRVSMCFSNRLIYVHSR